MDAQQLSFLAKKLFSGGIYLVVAVVVALVVQAIVIRAAKKLIAASGAPKASILLNIVRAVIWACALLCVLEPVFGITPTYFVATLGVVSLAISLGLQDTISNVFSGLLLMLGRVVKPGDDITVGSVSGKVTDVTWRSTTVLDRTGSVEVIPNSVLNKTSLTHLDPSEVGKICVPVQIIPKADLEDVTWQIVEIAKEAAGDMLNPAFEPVVLLQSMDAYGTKIVIVLRAAAGVHPDFPADKVLRAIQGKPWIATVLPK